MKIILAYHFPCLDGAYSSTVAYLFFRELKSRGYKIQDFIDYIMKIKSFKDITQPIFPQKSIPKAEQQLDKGISEIKISNIVEENDLNSIKDKNQDDQDNEYYPYIYPELLYLPVRVSPNGKLMFPKDGKLNEEEMKESVLILMDYYASSLSNILELCEKFKKLIILDHHLSFELILNEIQQQEQQKGQQEDQISLQDNITNKLANFAYHYDRSKCGSTVSFQFFERLLGKPFLSKNEAELAKLLQILDMVEDHDLKRGTTLHAEEYASAIFKRKMNFDINTNSNMFKELVDVNMKVLIEIGLIEKKNRINKAKKLSLEAIKIYIGGKISPDKGKYGICYGLETTEVNIRSEICEELALKSIESGYENMGFLCCYNPQMKAYKVSLRSIQKLEGGDCQTIAREYGGGGHYNAAGFFLDVNQIKKWFGH